MLKGIDVKEVIPFSSAQDEAEPKTVFMIGNISNRDKLRIFGQMASTDGTVTMTKLDERALDVLKAGVKSVKNLGGKDYDSMTEEVIDMLPSFAVMMELLGKVLEYNFQMEKTTEKN